MSDLNVLPEGFGVTDPDLIKTAQAEAKRERTETNDVLFLKTGRTHVTVLPPHVNSQTWFREYKEHPIHPNGKFTIFTCPSTVGMPCPICQKGQALYETKTEANMVFAKRYWPKKAYLYNVYVHSCPDGKSLESGIMVLKSGVNVYKKLIGYDTDNGGGWGDITNLENGIEFRIDRSGSGRMGTTYDVVPNPQRSNILTKLDAAGFKIGKPHDLSAVYPAKSYEELKLAVESDEPPKGE